MKITGITPSRAAHSIVAALIVWWRGYSPIVLSIIGMATHSLSTIERLTTDADHLSVAAKAVQRTMDGDMMHDAMRSDVLQAILAVKDGRTGEIKNAEDALNTHAVRFNEGLESTLKEKLLPANIIAAINVRMGYPALADEALIARLLDRSWRVESGR